MGLFQQFLKLLQSDEFIIATSATVVGGLLLAFIKTSYKFISNPKETYDPYFLHDRQAIPLVRWLLIWPLSPFRKSFWATIGLLLFLLVAEWRLSAPWFYYLLTGVLLFGNLFREQFTSYSHSIETALQLIKQMLRTTHGQVHEEIKGIASEDDHWFVRCNIMIYDPKDEKLHVKWTHNMDHDRDRNLSLDKWKGVAGTAFLKNRAYFGHIDEPPPHGPDWLLDEEDVSKIHPDLRSIWSFPLRDKDNIPFGVFNIDTDFKAEEDLITEVLLLGQNVANNSAIVLQLLR